MTSGDQHFDLAEHAWMLGESELDWAILSEGARRLRETRIAAMLFKRRWHLLIRWRRQTFARAHERRGISRPVARPHVITDGDIAILSDLPRRLPILREEIAVLRAFLSWEINVILFDEVP